MEHRIFQFWLLEIKKKKEQFLKMKAIIGPNNVHINILKYQHNRMLILIYYSKSLKICFNKRNDLYTL